MVCCTIITWISRTWITWITSVWHKTINMWSVDALTGCALQCTTLHTTRCLHWFPLPPDSRRRGCFIHCRNLSAITKQALNCRMALHRVARFPVSDFIVHRNEVFLKVFVCFKTAKDNCQLCRVRSYFIIFPVVSSPSRWAIVLCYCRSLIDVVVQVTNCLPF